MEIRRSVLTSRTDEATAHANGFPPNVLKWEAFTKEAAISGKKHTRTHMNKQAHTSALLLVIKTSASEYKCLRIHALQMICVSIKGFHVNFWTVGSLRA